MRCGHPVRRRIVILLDIHLPGVPGTEGVRLLRHHHPQAQVVMLTVFDAQEQVFESICTARAWLPVEEDAA